MFTFVAIFKRVSKIGIPLYYLTLSFDCAKDLFFTSIGISKTQTNRLYYPFLDKKTGIALYFINCEYYNKQKINFDV